MDTTEIAIRLGAAALLGAALGLNRDLHGKPTGVRTLALVGFSAAQIVIAAGDGDGNVGASSRASWPASAFSAPA